MTFISLWPKPPKPVSGRKPAPETSADISGTSNGFTPHRGSWPFHGSYYSPRGGLIIHSPHAEKIRTALLSFLLIFFSVVPIFAGEKEKSFGCAIVSEITSIYDGDTFRCNISGYPEIIGERIPIRINGIDTPELRDNRDHVKQLARQAKQHTVQRLREARKIELCNMKRGKYFRIVADVFVDGQDLGQELIQKGLAKPYDGGTKPDWL